MTTLNSRQQQAYGVAQQLDCFLHKNKRIYAHLTPVRNEVETLRRHLDSISEQATLKAQKGNAITAEEKA